MTRRLMIDPPGGWMYGFPIYVGEQEGLDVIDMMLDELQGFLVERGYPEAEALKGAKWTRFMWVNQK